MISVSVVVKILEGDFGSDESKCHLENAAKPLNGFGFTDFSATSISDILIKSCYELRLCWTCERETHLWYIRPDEVKSASLLNHYSQLLSPTEKDKVLQMRGDELKKNALLARTLVRTTIARYKQQDRSSVFIKLWTLKEAYVKALGKGFFAAPFNTFTIQSKPTIFTAEMTVSSLEKIKKCCGEWKFSLLELADSHIAAICTEDDQASGGAPMKVIVRKTIPFLEDELISESKLL